MKLLEYNNLLESLYIGHEFSFIYKNKTYFFERTNEGCILYDISNLILNGEVGQIVDEIKNNDLISLVNEFMNKKLFDGFSFNEVFNDVEIINLE